MKKVRFIDCGANIGQSIDWALDAFKDYRLKVDSFEPLPRNFEILEGKYSNHELVKLHNAAISTKNGTATFYCQNWGARTGSSLIKGKASASTKDTCEVSTVDLFGWIQSEVQEDELVILKIDIEGAEYDVLPHLFKNGLHDKVDYWFIEFHGKKSPNYSKLIEEQSKKMVNYFFDWGKMDEVESFKKQINKLLTREG